MLVVIVSTMFEGEQRFMTNPDTGKLFQFEDLEEAVKVVAAITKVPMAMIREEFNFYDIDKEFLDKQEQEI